jgi:hypothetical protein
MSHKERKRKEVTEILSGQLKKGHKFFSAINILRLDGGS